MFFKKKKKSDTQVDTASSSVGKPVAIYTSYDMNEVAFIKSMLMSADIDFHITNELTTGYGPIVAESPAAGGMDVLVREEDADDARTIINQLT